MSDKPRTIRALVIEITAFVTLIVVIIGLPVIVFSKAPWKSEYQDHRIIHLTAVAKDGVWTKERVTSMNYWNREFKPANLLLHRGEKILFRLTSMDVTHTFYVPDLNIGPVEVKGGMVFDVPFVADKTGAFVYYCTTICGDSHYYMQGKILIQEKNDTAFHSFIADFPVQAAEYCDHTHQDNLPDSFIERGQTLYNSTGCITCHGQSGRGGIYNPNYVNNFVPTLEDLAEKMRLFWQEDAETVIKLLENNADMNEQLEDPPFRQYNRFLAQYESIINKINDGAHDLQKADTAGPQPPLFMPAWEYQLSNEEMNAIVAYLINQASWEE